MRKGMKMLVATRERDDRGKDYGRSNYDYGRSNYDGGQRGEMNRHMDRGMESRFRDRRGREHYDNGRFAPRGNYGMESNYGHERDMESGYDMENNYGAESRRGRRRGAYAEMDDDDREDHGAESWYPYVPPVYQQMNPIGFSMEEKHKGGEMTRGRSVGMGRVPFTKEMAEEWMSGLKNEDGTKGPHWSIEQVKQVMAQKGVECDPWKLWAAMNAEYSDRSAVNKKHGVNNVDYYLDSAIAFWLKDRDAVDDKLSVYYMDVVKH